MILGIAVTTKTAVRELEVKVIAHCGMLEEHFILF
jgi:hypothetical protein